MGVYIKGMEMPKDRPQLLWIYPDGKVITVKSDADPEDNCNAVPVPPHGDLIDLRSVNLEDGPYEYQDWVEWALEQYLNAPIFIPAEEGEA